MTEATAVAASSPRSSLGLIVTTYVSATRFLSTQHASHWNQSEKLSSSLAMLKP